MREGTYEAAKWLKVPVLADAEEIASLLARLERISRTIELYRLGAPALQEELQIAPNAFLAAVARWNEGLQRGEAPSQKDLRTTLACAMTLDRNDLWLQKFPDSRCLVKISRPVVQIQAHYFTFSPDEKAFHSMVFGQKSIFWGLQFSYPQIFMDQGEPRKVDDSFENSALFREIRLWARNETRAVPFLIGEEKINVPFRLGKNCFSWIGKHPQLQEWKLRVADAG